MSKSSNNSNSLDDFINQQKALDHYVDILEDFNLKISTLSKTLEDSVSNIAKRELYIKDINNMSKIEIREYFNIIKKTLSDMGIEITKEAEKMLKSAEKSAIASSQRTGKMSLENLNNKTVNNVLSDLFTIAEKGALKGQNSVTIKDFSNNKVALDILKQINSTLGKKNQLDDFRYKIQAFFGEHFAENKKAFRGFARDIVEGIASSKFVGGALGDLIKLGGLMFNNWTQGRGKFMEGLGKVVLVLSQILSGLLSGGIISNILGLAFGRKLMGFSGNLLKGGFNLLKGLFKGGVGKALGIGSALTGFFGPRTMTTQMARSTLKAGTIFRDSATGKLRKVVEGAVKADGTKSLRTVAIKEASSVGKGASIFAKAGGFLAGAGRFAMGAVRGIPGLIGSLAATPLANKAVSMGANAYVAHGLSGVAQGALFGAMFGPIGAGIGAAIGGIAGLIKGHFARQAKEQDESKNFWQELLDMLKNSKLGQWLGFGSSSGGGGSSSSIPSGAEKKGFGSSWTDAKGAKDIGGLKVAKDGSILNLHKMTQDQASQALQAYEKSDPTAFNRIYEWAGSGHANLASFQTDAVKKVNGQKVGALMYKGASADLDALRAELVKAGMDPSKANALSFTSGKLTGSNKSHGVGGWRSHNNQYGLAFDLGGGGAWTQADYDKYGSLVSDFYRNRASQKFNINYEKAGQGKSTGKHWDVKPISNYRPAGAVENEKEAQQQQKITAQKHSIDTIGLVAKLEGKEKADAIGKAHLGNEEAFKEAYENELKKYGITHMKDSKGKERWYYHDSEQNVTKEFDPTGNLDVLKKQMTYMTNNAQ